MYVVMVTAWLIIDPFQISPYVAFFALQCRFRRFETNYLAHLRRVIGVARQCRGTALREIFPQFNSPVYRDKTNSCTLLRRKQAYYPVCSCSCLRLAQNNTALRVDTSKTVGPPHCKQRIGLSHTNLCGKPQSVTT
ncbi:hypothetical protein J6590_051566 [Homalodisca vitripennis]|nr:hypothetical protein J6590_051566 [Homalodisca vitripennis]